MKRFIAFAVAVLLLGACSGPDSSQPATPVTPPTGSVETGPGAIGQPVEKSAVVCPPVVVVPAKKHISSQPAGKPNVVKRAATKVEMVSVSAYDKIRARLDRLEEWAERHAHDTGSASPREMIQSP